MDQQKPDPHIVTREALFPDDRPAVEELFFAYVRQFSEQLGFDLDFQDFAREVANLPGAYARPTGCVLFATDATNHNIGVVGCDDLTTKRVK